MVFVWDIEPSESNRVAGDLRESAKMKNARVAKVALAGLFLCLLPLAASAQAVFIDNFNDNSLNPNVWVSHSNGMPTLSETNSRLEVTLPANSAGAFFYADVQTTWRMTGDFDVQVDYTVLNWPASNGVRIGLIGAGAGVERISRGTGEYGGVEHYTTDIGGTISSIVDVDPAGTLRLVRTGTKIFGYYLDSEHWTLVGSGTCTADDTPLALSGWSQAAEFGRQDVRFAFDNFQVNSGQIVSEPATLSLLGLGGLTLIRRRRK